MSEKTKPVKTYYDFDLFYSSDNQYDNDDDDDFNNFSDSDDEFFIKPTRKRARYTSGSREQRARNMVARKYSTRRKKKYNSDDDSEDGDFVGKIMKHTRSAITSHRTRKSVEDGDFVSSISFEDIAKSEDVSEDEVMKLFSEHKKPQVESILGVEIDEETEERKYYVKIHNEPIAHAIYLTEAELLDHPSGQSQLDVFLRQEEEEGLNKSIEIPTLSVVGDTEENRPPIERIVTYDEEKELYLVKWKDLSYEYASWVADVKDEELIKRFKARNTANKSTVMVYNKVCKPYGEGNGCVPLPTYKNGNTLRSYQVEALNWMRAAYHIGQNAILADEMGLGKTVMCISLLVDIIQNCGHDGPFLIVAPLSTHMNWMREFENWSNIDVILFHGKHQDRDLIAEYELFLKPPRQDVTKFQVLLTNLETVQKSIDIIQSINWHFVIIDEAHKLKNIHSKIYQMMFSLQMEHVLLMTGTPIQNNIDEIYALMHFIDPIKFASLSEFKKTHGSISNAEDVSKLQATLRPYMLRRKKCDVEASIGLKEETIVEVELTRTQKFYYRLLIGKKSHELSTHKSYALAQDLNNLAMHLRKVCNHPYLFDGVEDEVKKPGENPYEAMINASGKLVFVDKLLASLRPKGSKVLIFSQMVQILNILEDFLEYRNYPYVRLDGSVIGEERQYAIDKFCDPEEDVFVFLLCTKAGGVGLNLTAADTVIIYDSDWNPQNDLQAEARCHRIGQTKDVNVYRLITRGTYEQEMFDRASLKLGLDQAILDSGYSNAEMTPKEIETLIKRGAYHIFNDDESAADEFVAEDVEQILQNHTKVLTKSAVDKESVFSKASFVVDKDGAKIDFNDENFWERVIPENLRNQKEEEKPLPPRRSRSVQSYNEAELERALKPEKGFAWSVKTRDILLKALLSLGFGRWKEILAKTQLKADKKKIQNGCLVLVHLISMGLSDPGKFLMEIIGSDEIELTKAQLKIKNNAAFSSSNFISILNQDAEENSLRLRQLHAISQWHKNGSKFLKFHLGDDAPEKWTNRLDQKLLKQVWNFGFGNWKPILKDETYSRFQTSELEERLTFISNALIKKFSSKPTPIETPVSFPSLKPADMRLLERILSDYGLPEDDNTELWAKYAEFFPETNDFQTLVKSIVKCIRVIAYYDPSLPTNNLRNWLDKILLRGNALASAINQEQALYIKENIDFVTRLRSYSKKILPTLKPVSDPPRVYVPEAWVVGENDIKLIKNVCKYHFSNIYEMVLKEIPEQFNEHDLELFKASEIFYRKRMQHKSIRGDNAFYIEDFSIKDRIEDFIDQNGGWKDIPRIIYIPEGKADTIALPYSYGDVVIESTGDGEFFLYNGYICRIGLATTAYYRKMKFTCIIEGKDKFIVKRKEKVKYEGKTPFEAWQLADPDFDGFPEEYFGISCSQVIALYDTICTPNVMKENGIEGYIKPTILTFPSND